MAARKKKTAKKKATKKKAATKKAVAGQDNEFRKWMKLFRGKGKLTPINDDFDATNPGHVPWMERFWNGNPAGAKAFIGFVDLWQAVLGLENYAIKLEAFLISSGIKDAGGNVYKAMFVPRIAKPGGDKAGPPPPPQFPA